MRPRCMRLRRAAILVWVLMVALLLLGGPLPPPMAAAQATRPDPAGYLPADMDLPPGFVHQPDQDRGANADLGSSTFKTYARIERAPRSPSVLGLHASSSDTTATARKIFQNAVAAWEAEGWVFQPLDGVIGEQAALGRKSFGTGGSRFDGIMVYFRVGAITGGSVLLLSPDAGGAELALASARLVEDRAWAQPWGEIATSRPAVPSSPASPIPSTPQPAAPRT